MVATMKPRFEIPGLPSYFGSKGAQGTFHRLINAMPAHDVYIEAFAGSGRLARIKALAPVANVVVELDAQLCDLWRSAHGLDVEVYQGSAFDAVPHLVASHIRRGVQGSRILVYCDPPYILATRRDPRPTYHHEFCDEDHLALFAMLQALPCRVMVSHLPCVEYANAFADWHTFTYQNTTRRGLQLEQVWTNYVPSPDLHDPRFIGATFREREQVKRQLAIIRRRFAALPPAARIAALAMLDAR